MNLSTILLTGFNGLLSAVPLSCGCESFLMGECLTVAADVDADVDALVDAPASPSVSRVFN